MNEGTTHYGRIQIKKYEQNAEMMLEAYGRRRLGIQWKRWKKRKRMEGWKDGKDGG
jgi:hypothetical protein